MQTPGGRRNDPLIHRGDFFHNGGSIIVTQVNVTTSWRKRKDIMHITDRRRVAGSHVAHPALMGMSRHLRRQVCCREFRRLRAAVVSGLGGMNRKQGLLLAALLLSWCGSSTASPTTASSTPTTVAASNTSALPSTAVRLGKP